MDAHFDDKDEDVEDDDDAGGGGVSSIFVAAARTWGCVIKRKTANTAIDRMNAIVDWSLGNTVDRYRSLLRRTCAMVDAFGRCFCYNRAKTARAQKLLADPLIPT